ncbi:MAG: octaprenyl-diphosphate synthase [Pseudomonadota bacterium]|jgi:octaprenyl-diphosphate synthase
MQESVLEEAKHIINELQDERTAKLFNNLATGKMVRAKLILEIGGTKAVKLAAIVELIHLASLLHDDVIDHSNTRRGKPTINSIYGEHTAVMLGDILYSKAFASLVAFDKVIAEKIALSVSKLSIGELADVALSEQFNTNSDVYMHMIYNKTASLIEAACYSAAILNGFDADDFGKYGKSLGIAFQLVDDLLDIFGDETTLGKPAFGDLKEGKTTIAYIKLYNAMNSEEQLQLKNLFKQTPTVKDKEWLFAAFAKYDIRTECDVQTSQIMKDGLEAIDNTNAPELLKKRLKEIAIKQLGRTF